MRFRDYANFLRAAAAATLRGDRETLERERRKLEFARLRGKSERFTFRRGEIVWTAFTQDRGISRTLFLDGEHQGEELRVVLEWLRERGFLGAEKNWIVDVGANIGTPAIPAARVTGRRVLAIEPVPGNVELLRENVSQNGLADRVLCAPAAISSRPGRITMACHQLSGSCEVWEPRGQDFGEEARGTVEVEAIPLDRLLEKHGISPREVAYVWSDTQGYEREVLATGASLWRAGVPIYLELWPKGLEVHGGIGPFVETSQMFFRGLVLREDLFGQGAAAKPRAIGELERILAAIPPDKETDALLVP